MTHVTRSVSRLTLAALLLSAAATIATAAPKPLPQATPLGHDPITGIRLGPTSSNSTCTLGITDPPAYLIDYLLPPNDGYYTLIDPAQCAACGSGTVNALTAHVYLNFRVACAVPVSVGIYGATGDAACWAPDVNTVICPPFVTNLVPGVPGNYNFSIPIPGGCCISQPAFLKIEFITLPTACNSSPTYTIPRLITTGACSQACTSYNIYPGIVPPGHDDLCVDIGFPGNPVMNLDVDCCNSTPTRKHSWGTMKSTYR